MSKIKNRFWRAALFLSSAGVSLLLGTQLAHAGLFDGFYRSLKLTVAAAFYGIPYLAGYLGYVFLGIASGLVSTAIEKNYAVLSESFVTIGFKQALTVANLGFVLAIIIIAFATILRSQSYGIKQMIG